MSEPLPQSERESREITTTEALDQLLGSGIVTFVSKDGTNLPIFEGPWEFLPSSLGPFFEGLTTYLGPKDLGNITTINVYFGKNSQRTALEGILPYGMILTRKPLSDKGELIALNFTQYNIDEILLKSLMDNSIELLDQLMNFFPQCENEVKIELIQLLRPVIVDAFREGHVKEIVQQTTGSVHFQTMQEIMGDWKRFPWGMGGARSWTLKTLQGPADQDIHSLVTFILDQLDHFDLEFNRYMSIQNPEFLERIIDTGFDGLDTFVGTPLEWMEQVEKSITTITSTAKQEQRILNFFRNELKRYVAKVSIPSIVAAYVNLLHENKGIDKEFVYIDSFGAYLQRVLMDALDQGALAPDDPRIYVSTQISSVLTEFRKSFDVSSRGAFNALVTKTLESIRTFDLPKIVLDSGYLLQHVTNMLIQWSKRVNMKISATEEQLTERAQVLDAEQKKIDERYQILSEKEKKLKARRERLLSEEEQLKTKEHTLDEEKTQLDEIETALNTEKKALEAEKQTIIQTKMKLDETANQLSAEEQQLTVNHEVLTTEKTQLEEQLRSLTEGKETSITKKAKIKEQFNTITANQETLIAEKEELEQQLGSLTANQDALAIENAKLDYQLSSLITKEEALAAEKAQLEEQLRSLTAKEEASTTEKVELERQLSALTTKHETLAAEKARLEEQRSSLTPKEESVTTEKAELERQLSALAAYKATLVEEKERLEEQLDNIASLETTNKNEGGLLVQQIQECETKLKTVNDQKTSLSIRTQALEQEKSALDERNNALNDREETWKIKVAELQEARDKWSSNFEMFQNEKLELETAFSDLEKDKALFYGEYAAWKTDRTALLEKINALELEKTNFEQTKTALEQHTEFLGEKIDQEFGEILTYEIAEIVNLSQSFRTKFPTYFEEACNLGRAERVEEEWTVDLLEEIPKEYEISCEFEEFKEHMRYWASPVGGLFPQRVEIFFTNSDGERTGNVLFIFQNQRSRFSKQLGIVLAKEMDDGPLLLRDLRDRSRQLLEQYDSSIQKDAGA